MASSFAAQLVEALENSWPAVARPNQLPPPGIWWQIWLLLAGRGFGKTRTLAEWVCEQAASGQSQQDCTRRGHGRRCARCLG
jgi:phage terminase large subunit-like protein